MLTIYNPGTVSDPIEWWEHSGRDIPVVMDLAKRVLSVPPTASGGERNWSAFANIWSDKRSLLLVGRVT